MKGAIEVLKSIRDICDQCIGCGSCPYFKKKDRQCLIGDVNILPGSWTDDEILYIVKIAGKEVKKE